MKNKIIIGMILLSISMVVSVMACEFQSVTIGSGPGAVITTNSTEFVYYVFQPAYIPGKQYISSCSLIINGKSVATMSAMLDYGNRVGYTFPALGKYTWMISCNDTQNCRVNSSIGNTQLVGENKKIRIDLISPVNNQEFTNGNVIFKAKTNDYATRCELIFFDSWTNQDVRDMTRKGHTFTESVPYSIVYENLNLYPYFSNYQDWFVRCYDADGNYRNSPEQRVVRLIHIDKKYTSCKKNSDCFKTSSESCPCNAGGDEIAVNKLGLRYYPRGGSGGCNMVDYCSSKSIKCIDRRCAVTNIEG